MKEKVLSGFPSGPIARFVQEDCGEATDMDTKYLASKITSFRNSISPAEIKHPVVPKVLLDKAEELEKGINELEELAGLYEIQIERIRAGRKMEKTVNVLMPSMANEIRQAREILNTSAQLKMDLGIDDRHLGTLDIDAEVNDKLEQALSEGTRKVLMNPESRKKVLELADKFLGAESADSEE